MGAMASNPHRVALLLAVALAACSSGDGDRTDAARSSTAAPSTTSSTAPAPTPTTPPSELRLDLRGLGAVRVGMTVAEAGTALGRPLVPVVPPPAEECAMYGPESGFDGIAFLVARGEVARADVVAGTTATTEGVAIGQTEAEAQRRYGGRLEVTPHDFQIGGHYLTLVPAADADAGFRLVIETDGTKVTALRAGRLPEVELTEACA
jgi:hypothetical protein